MIAADTVTLWHLDRGDLDHAAWDREVVSGCRAEERRGGRASNPQETVDDSMALYVFSDVTVSEGDMVALGAVDSGDPPAGAMRVTSVLRYTLGGALHHLEVTCR